MLVVLSHRNKSLQGLLISPGLPKPAPLQLTLEPSTGSSQLGRGQRLASAGHCTCVCCPHGIPNPALVPSLQMHGKSLGAGLGLSFPLAQDFLWGSTVLAVPMILKGYFEWSFKTPGQIDCSAEACPRHNLLSLQQIPQTLKRYTFQ